MEVDPFAVALSTPLSTAGGGIERREGFVVRTTDPPGVGEATPLPGWTESRDTCAAALERGVDAAARGDDPLDAVGDVPAAHHGVELARLDGRARRDGRPLYRALGGERPVEDVPVNATVGDADVDATVAAATDAVDRGFDCLKVKVGARAVETDAERLAAVREAVGPDVELRADANEAWSRDDAAAALSSFADADVRFVEQPVARGDLDGLASLTGGAVGVAADEALTAHSVAAVLDAGVEAVVCKPMVLGGPRRARDVTATARDAGAVPVVTTTIDAVVARTAAVHVAASLPDPPACGLATGDLLAEDLAPDPAPVADGVVRVPSTPGVGIDPREVRP
ncbi:MAG: mandelate racemase/muconate lactonizing enzyme family protein [Haloarculaceae archaeon]